MKTLVLFSLGVLLFYLTNDVGCSKEKPHDIIIQTDTIYLPCPELNKKNLEREIESAPFRFPKWTYKQSLFETNHLDSSQDCVKINALWGLTDSAMIEFPDWRVAVWYFAGWQKGRGADRFSTYPEFISACWVCPDRTEYVKRLTQFK